MPAEVTAEICACGRENCQPCPVSSDEYEAMRYYFNISAEEMIPRSEVLFGTDVPLCTACNHTFTFLDVVKQAVNTNAHSVEFMKQWFLLSTPEIMGVPFKGTLVCPDCKVRWQTKGTHYATKYKYARTSEFRTHGNE